MSHGAGGAIAHANFLKQNMALKQVWHLFVPLLLYSVISSLVGIVDMFLAAALGSNAQAAVGFGDQVIFLVVVVGTGLCTACSSFVAQSVGANKLEEAGRYARDSQMLAILIGLCATLAGITLAGTVLDALKCTAQLKELALPYIQICSLANCPFVAFLCQSAVLRAIDRAGGATMIGIVSTVVSIAGSFMAFNFLPPPLGHSLNALALAWIAGALSGMLYGSFLLNKFLPKVSETATFCPGTLDRLFALATMALPAIGGELAFIAANFGRYALIAGIPDSAQAQAAWTIRLKLEETIAILPLMALGYAVAVVCGQYIGAGRKVEVRGICTKVAIIAAFIMLIPGVILAAGADTICSAFTSDDATLGAAITLLQPAPVALPCCAIWLVLCGGLDGAGLTKTSGLINTADALIGRLLFSFMLIANGAAGLATASSLSSIMTAMLSCGFFYWQFRQAARTRG